MAQFFFQPVDASVLVWRQGEGTVLAAPGSARPERRFDVLADGVFVWGRRRPTVSAPPSSTLPVFVHHYRQQGIM